MVKGRAPCSLGVLLLPCVRWVGRFVAQSILSTQIHAPTVMGRVGKKVKNVYRYDRYVNACVYIYIYMYIYIYT